MKIRDIKNFVRNATFRDSHTGNEYFYIFPYGESKAFFSPAFWNPTENLTESEFLEKKLRDIYISDGNELIVEFL